MVDDGSTDDTWQWLEQQPDVVRLRQSNQGQTWAINRGVASAQGRYIRFLDSDDFLSAGSIDRQYQTALEAGADLVYSKVDTYRHPAGDIIEAQELEPWSDFIAVQLGEPHGSHFLGMLFRRELVEQVPRRPDFAYREDRMFLLEIGLLSPKIAYAPNCAGYWVQHAEQMQANYQGMKAVVANWQHLNIYRRILPELARRGELDERRKRAAARILWPLAHWIGYTHPRDAAEVADWVFQLDPSFRPPEPGWLGTLYRRLGFRKTEVILALRRAFDPPFMKDAFFSAFLRLPRFPGRDRLMVFLRDQLYEKKPGFGLHGLRLHLDPMEWTQLELMHDPHGQEPLTLQLYGRILHEGDTCVDVGTHIGFHTLVARHYLGASGLVLAVEPQPYHGDKILANWRANGFENIVVQVAAAGAESGFVSLPHQSTADRARLSLADSDGKTAPSLRFRVPVLPLASVFAQNGVTGPIRLLKIDVEGFEAAVLDGLGAASSQVENVILELLKAPDLRTGDSLPALERLSTLEFTRWRTVEGNPWQPGQPLPENNLWASRPGSPA